MALRPVTRAPALPSAVGSDPHASPWQSVRHHAATRGDDVAMLVPAGEHLREVTWAELARDAERAGAGLIRSGLRADQIVLSLLPGHARPELELALRVMGAVVIQVAAQCSPEDVARELVDVDVRLVIAEDATDLHRLHGLSFPSAQLFALDGGRGWERLLQLGAERLAMDPGAVSRIDQVIDQREAGARLLRQGQTLGRIAPGLELAEGVIPSGGVSVLLGDLSDPHVQLVRAAHVVAGGTLVHVADSAQLEDVLARVTAQVLAMGDDADDVLAHMVERASVPSPRARWMRRRVEAVVPPRPQRGAVPAMVVAPRVSDPVRAGLEGLGATVSLLPVLEIVAADLPVPPPVVRGDATHLPRRSRRAPDREFQLSVPTPHATGESAQTDEPDASAFELPSLPLFGGESFLDRLLIAQSRGGPA